MYTDNYEEETTTSTSNDTGSSSKGILKVVAVVVLALILLGLLYFVLKGRNNNSSTSEDKYTLSIYPETILIPYGKTQNISYEVRNDGVIVPNATARLTVVDENIAKVDNSVITGVNYGKTTLMVTYVSTDGKSYQDSKEVTVADGDPAVAITNVNFPDGDLQMPFNGTYNINLGINPTNGYVENKTITSSNSNVVLVDNSGLVTAVSEGEAIITVSINNGQFTKEMLVYVNKNNEISSLVVSPTGISINDSVTSLKEGESAVLKYTIIPSNASIDNIKWTSSNEDVVSVDYRGKITAKKVGIATIKATTFNNISDSISIEVLKKEVLVSSIELSILDLNLVAGETQVLVPIVLPTDATDRTLTYEVDNQSVATIIPSADSTSVTITAIASGTATLTIKASNGITKTVNVVVSGEIEEEPSGGGGGSCGKCKDDCGAGKYCNCGKCVGCPAGNYCYNNTKTACAAGKGSISNSSSYQDCSYCSKGYYSTGNGKGCIACPSGKTTKSVGATSKSDCVDDPNAPTPTPTSTVTCNLGQYVDSTGKCATCPTGKYCKDGKKTYDCPAGKGKATGAKYSINCQLCNEGYISSAGGSCKKCASGKSNSSRTACVDK